jgi:hypothetical protein
LTIGLIVAFTTLLLSSRGINDTLRDMDMAPFCKAHIDFGFQPGPTPFTDSMFQQSAQRGQLHQRIANQVNRQQAIDCATTNDVRKSG